MRIPWNVEDLEIVGYADVLDETMLPSVVPPVFRIKAEPQRALLPPYSLNAGFLCNATEVPVSELEELRGSHEITLFDAEFPARRDFELWIDQSFQLHYQPLDEAGQNLSRIATEQIGHAEDAFRKDDLGQAERSSGVALSADDARVEPLAIKAAICRIRGDQSGERLMAKLAASVLEERLFNLLVEDYCASRQQLAPAVVVSSLRRPPMRGMACEPTVEPVAA